MVGSSPRLWGTRKKADSLATDGRFIPTPVGNTRWAQLHDQCTPVHPHACGEHGHRARRRTENAGSSPRLWGTHLIQGHRTMVERFIPTPVGNTPRFFGPRLPAPVHPHACGEHAMVEDCIRRCGGSSPRLWGTRLLARLEAWGRRFIPTPVGNTPLPSLRSANLPVHPHACGEHLFLASANTVWYGSSPRLWGTPRRAEIMRVQFRFIPTPVGNTIYADFETISVSVHPHACGEHYGGYTNRGVKNGSSPRLWGTLDCLIRVEILPRFIPTPVGNTLPLSFDILVQFSKSSMPPAKVSLSSIFRANRNSILWQKRHELDTVHFNRDAAIGSKCHKIKP